MRISLRPAAMAAATLATLALAAASWAVSHATVRNALAAETEHHLGEATRLGAERLQASQDLSLDSVASLLARSTRYRVSIFDRDLALLADSDLRPGAPDPLGLPERRTEVAGALSRTMESSTRSSALDGRSYVFSAVRSYWHGAAVVVRFGTPLDPLNQAAFLIGRRVALAVLGVGSMVLVALFWALGRMTDALDAVRRLLGQVVAPGVGGARVSLSPITELSRVESAANRVRSELQDQVAQASRERDELTQLMDQVAEGLIALTDDARILRINPAAKAFLGLTDVLPFAPVGSVVRDPALRDALEESVVRPESRLEVTVGERELEVRTQRGSEGGSVVLLVDVTEIRRLEEVRSDFVANASHELKTPLTVIRGAAETILDEGLPPELRSQFLRSIEGNTVRLQHLVDDLLDLSRYESGAWRPTRDVVCVDEVAWSVWGELEGKAAERGVDFRVSGTADALGDEAAVYQIFQNLFDNALRYVPEGTGVITVDIGTSESLVTVSVQDNGAGIPAAALPRIFERFYRVDAARSREEGGTGLGLAIVRHLISSMGGTVSASSALGSGTTITFTVPRSGSPREERSTA